MTKHVQYLPTEEYMIEDVLKWINNNLPKDISSSVTPVKEIGTSCWKVEWYAND